MTSNRSAPILIRHDTKGRLIDDVYLPVYSKDKDGCEYSPSCFTCPLPECKWEPGAWRERQKRAMKLKKQGMDVPLIADKLRVTPRTVYAYLGVSSSEEEYSDGVERRVA